MMDLPSRARYTTAVVLVMIGMLALLRTEPPDQTFSRGRRLTVSKSHPAQGNINTFKRNDLLENVSYSELRAAVITKYFASHPDETDKEQMFDDALMAMKLVETDGTPIPMEGIDGLYVGSIGKLYMS